MNSQKKAARRKSLGELDITSFLSSLGGNDDDNDFHDAKDSADDDPSFYTAYGGSGGGGAGEDDDGDVRRQSSIKKKKKNDQLLAPPSAIKKVKDDEDEDEDDVVSKSSKKANNKNVKPSASKASKVQFNLNQNDVESPAKEQKSKILSKVDRKAEKGGKVAVGAKAEPAAAQKKKKKSDEDEEENGDKIAPPAKRAANGAKEAVSDKKSKKAKTTRDEEDQAAEQSSKSSRKSSSKKQQTVQVEDVEEEDDEDDEEELHRKELEQLKESDPEFYKHLQSEASDLLHFGSDEEGEEDDEDEKEVLEEGVDEDEDEEEDDSTHAEQQAELTVPALKKLEARALRGDAASTRKLIRAFRNGLRSGFDSTKQKKKTRAQQEKGEFDEDVEANDARAVAFTVAPEVYEHLVTVSLKTIAAGLQSMLWPTSASSKSDSSKKQKKPFVLASTSPHFPAHKMKIKQLLTSFSKTLHSRDTSPSVLQHLLLSLRLFVGYFGSVPAEGKRLLQVLITLWCRPETENAARLACFFRVRQLCDLARAQFLELALKDMYVAFARSATSAKTAEMRERIAVQARCLVELYGLDFAVSYRVGFQHIRQLALHVRSAMASKTLESLQSVCSWQFVHCLRLWALVLATHHQVLGELKFPMIQVALGVLSLVSTSRYDPLRLHCVEVINRICESNSMFAPVSIHLLHMLRSSDLIEKKIVPATDPPPELSALLKFKEDQIRKASTRLVLVPRICDLLLAHLKQHRASVAFPELWNPIKAALYRTGLVASDDEDDASGKGKKRFKMSASAQKGKGDKGEAWRLASAKALKELIDACDGWSAKVREARDGRIASIKRPGGPSNVDGCEKFSQAMRDVFQAEDEQKLTRKQRQEKKGKRQEDDEEQAMRGAQKALFPSAGSATNFDETVESILTEAAMEVNGDNGGEDDEREIVRKLNPKDFL